ncbi:hypothetical protein BZM26_34945 [Paraburkholderia strydomiana]|nr:hypothetical protein BZM26_34945 [Paraburkholderia strydomiana]
MIRIRFKRLSNDNDAPFGAPLESTQKRGAAKQLGDAERLTEAAKHLQIQFRRNARSFFAASFAAARRVVREANTERRRRLSPALRLSAALVWTQNELWIA